MNETIGNNLIQLVYRNSRRTGIPAVLAIVFIGYFLSINTEGLLWFYWVALSILTYTLRPFVMYLLKSTQTMSVRRKLIATEVYSFFGGSVMGMSVLFFPQLDTSERLIVSLQLAGFGAGGSAASAGYSPLFLCFIIPLLVPLGIVWMSNPVTDLDYIVSFSVGALIIMMVAVLALLGRDTFNTFSAYVELSERQAEMSTELADALDRAQREQNRAEASNRSKSRFLAAASHDLRQPVHVVSLYCAALDTMVKDPRIGEVVTDMNSAVELLSSQLDALLDITKLDSGVVKPELQIMDLQLLVDGVVEELKADAVAKGLYLVSRVDGPLYVTSDSNMLAQILRNLVGNAVKFTREGGVILSTVVDEDCITLACEDTGVGMTECEIEHIVEEFFQVDNPERNKIKGMGLGLSIVDRLVNCLSHNLAFESVPGTGTSVTLRLRKALATSDIEGEKKKQTRMSMLNVPFHHWVHVVDDEASVRKSMTLLLSELGCRVTTTSTTKDTVRFLKFNRPHIVLSDLRLQREDSGIETLRAVKASDPDILRVMITGETFLRSNDTGLEQDVKILHKPVSKTRMVELLESIDIPS